ncbi:MAG: alpha/beta hydrolase [Sphingomicrobium sp.]
MNRLILLFAILLLGACAPAARPPIAPMPVVAAQSLDLPAANGRKVPLTIWRAPAQRGVILFGHGLGGQPSRYEALIDRWVAHGYSVVAPLSVDSMAYADRDKYDLQAGFRARVEDLMIARGYIAAAFPGQKVALAGHSYGSLFALIGAGAITPAGALKGPPVAAVLTFSSPGAVPQLVTDSTYASVAAPLLMITGDKDVVPGFVADAAAHRLPFDRSPAGNKMLVTVTGGAHDLVVHGDAATTAALARLTLEYLDTWLAGSPVARKALAAERSTASYRIERR